MYTWCVLDTLILAGLLDCDVAVESRSPLSAQSLHASLSDGKLDANPKLVVSFPRVLDEGGAPFTDSFCPYANLFGSKEDYLDWAAHQARATAAISLERAKSIALEFAHDVTTKEPDSAVVTSCTSTVCA